MTSLNNLSDRELVMIIKDGIATGRITSFKREEEKRRISRTKISAEIGAGVYLDAGKLGSQRILVADKSMRNEGR